MPVSELSMSKPNLSTRANSSSFVNSKAPGSAIPDIILVQIYVSSRNWLNIPLDSSPDDPEDA